MKNLLLQLGYDVLSESIVKHVWRGACLCIIGRHRKVLGGRESQLRLFHGALSHLDSTVEDASHEPHKLSCSLLLVPFEKDHVSTAQADLLGPIRV